MEIIFVFLRIKILLSIHQQILFRDQTIIFNVKGFLQDKLVKPEIAKIKYINADNINAATQTTLNMISSAYAFLTWPNFYRSALGLRSPVPHLPSSIAACRGRVALLGVHGGAAPRGADDPPAAHVLCSQEIVQRHPQFHVAASGPPLDLSDTIYPG